MAAASECMPARSSTAQWEGYLTRYVSESADFDALTEEKIWSVLNEQFPDVPVTARKEVRTHQPETCHSAFGKSPCTESNGEKAV